MANPTAIATPEPTRRGVVRELLSWLLVLVCVACCVYPTLVTLRSNQVLSTQSQSVVRQGEAMMPQVRDAVWRDAVAYNEELAQRPFSPPPIGLERTHPGFAHYDQLLRSDGTDAMATIVIPTVGISLPVFHGTSDEVLRRGAGHLYGTSLPVGGTGSLTAIAGHTGMVTASMFDNVRFMQPGDEAYINTVGVPMRYVMVSSKVVGPNEQHAFAPEPGKDLLVLITCTPYGVNSDRLIVTLERTALPDPVPASARGLEDMRMYVQWWMWVATGVACVLVLIMVVSTLRRMRRHTAHAT